MAYKQVDERFWKDAKVKKLSKDGYLFFLYLLTSPHTHYTGITEMNLDYVNIDTPLSERESKAAFRELVSLDIIAYDKQNKIVWIKNMHKYQVKSEKQLRGAQAHINSLPKSELCAALADTLSIPYRYPIDTLPIQAKAKEEAKEEEKEEEEEEAKAKPPCEKTAALIEIPEHLNTEKFHEAWAAWEQYRKERKKKLTPATIKQQIKMLAEWGEKRAVAAIMHSITNGWTGIFEPKPDAPKKGTWLEDLNSIDFTGGIDVNK